MPWLAVPYADRERKSVLSKFFDVSGIPSLVLLAPGLETVANPKARGAAGGDPTGASFPAGWLPQKVNDLSVEIDGINDTPSLLVFCERATEAGQAAIRSALEAASDALKAEGEYKFFTSTEADEGEIGSRVRQMLGLEALPGAEEAPRAFLLDLSDEGAYYEYDPVAVAAWATAAAGHAGGGVMCDGDSCRLVPAGEPAAQLITAEVTTANLVAFARAFKAGKLTKKKLNK